MEGGSSLFLDLSADPVFLIFSGGTPPPGIFVYPDETEQRVTGPLGKNPAFLPIDPSNATVPISGQPISLTITNIGPLPLVSIAFYLLEDAAALTSPFEPQPDGITFGLYCAGMIDPADCTLSDLDLLGPPSSTSGTINPADLSVATPTYGDLLRFHDVNLAPGATGRFNFFITDTKGTVRLGTGGGNASESLALVVIPQAIPEPGTWIMALAGLGVAALARARRRTQHSVQ